MKTTRYVYKWWQYCCKSFGLKIPNGYRNNVEAVLGVNFYWDTVYVYQRRFLHVEQSFKIMQMNWIFDLPLPYALVICSVAFLFTAHLV